MERYLLTCSKVISLCLVFSIVGCSQELSRSKAASTIRQHYHYPLIHEGEFQYPFNRESVGSYDLRILNALKDAGLIQVETKAEMGKITLEGVGVDRPFERLVVHLTDKARPYITKVEVRDLSGWNHLQDKWQTIKVRVCETLFSKVTGIATHNQSNIVSVDYQTQLANPTPFNDVLKSCEIGRVSNRTTSFRKYDDGWRIAN